MAVQLVLQETPRSCGAACVAMLAGRTWQDGVLAVGKDGLTTTRQIVAALRSLGVTVGDSLRKLRRGDVLPAGVIVKILWIKPGGRQSHWAVYVGDGTVLDPWHGKMPLAHYGEPKFNGRTEMRGRTWDSRKIVLRFRMRSCGAKAATAARGTSAASKRTAWRSTSRRGGTS